MAIPPPLLISAVWTGQPPAGWLMSEKFDGIRAFWDGAQLWTRGGNLIHAPAWWLAMLPAGVQLDGELWLGRGRYGEAMGAGKRIKPIESTWCEMRLCAFDRPDMGARPFAERAATLAQFGNAAVMPVQQVVCTGLRHLKAEVRSIFSGGGEGVMLRDPSAPYVVGPAPSDTLQKVRWEANTGWLVGLAA
jgi:DNA ligase-1